MRLTRTPTCHQLRGCLRGRSNRQTVYRLKYPIKRVGKRGESKFERISWRGDHHYRRAPVQAVQLTLRERQLLHYVANGATNRETGLHLFLGENTVKNHIKHTLNKLQVENRARAVACAMREGLLTDRLET